MVLFFVAGAARAATLSYSASEIDSLLTQVISNRTALASLGAVGGNPYSWWFTPRVDGFARSTNTTAGPITITNYADTITYSLSLTPIAYQLGYDVLVSNTTETVKFYSTEGFFDVDEDTGAAGSLVDGTDIIKMVSASLTRDLPLTAVATLPGETGYVEDLAAHVYAPGSVKHHVNTNMLAQIAGHDGSDANLAIYSVQDHVTTNYVRNTNCWAYTLDLTCASPWNSTGDGALANKTGLPSGQFRAATAITPRHLLSAYHYHLMQTWSGVNTNREVRFVTQDNQVIIRHVVDYQPVLDIDTNEFWNTPSLFVGADFVVLRLDEDLPSTITPAKRLPDNWGDYMPYTQGFTNALNNKRYNENFLLVMTDQQERATIGESFAIGLGHALSYIEGYPNYNYGFAFTPGASGSANCYFEKRGTYVPYYRDKINGDSSSPMLLYVRGEPIITGTLTTGGGGGSWVPAAACYEGIQAAIASFGDTNIWKAIDLSAFNTYERID